MNPNALNLDQHVEMLYSVNSIVGADVTVGVRWRGSGARGMGRGGKDGYQEAGSEGALIK